jgi:hypothetical protein
MHLGMLTDEIKEQALPVIKSVGPQTIGNPLRVTHRRYDH